LVTDYLDYAKKRCIKKVYEEKVAAFQRLLDYPDFNPDMLIQQIRAEAVLKHLQKQNETRSGNAVNSKDRKNLLAAWNKIIVEVKKWKLDNPFDVPKFPEERKPRYVPYDEEDLEKLFDVVENGQDRVMLLTYQHTLARRSAILNLKPDDLNFHKKEIRLWTRKRENGNLEFYWVPMTDELAEALEDHMATLPKDSEYVFLNPETGKPYQDRRRWIPGLCKRAGVRIFNTHSIRHLSASVLDQNAAPLDFLQRLLGHEQRTTTEGYIHRLRKAKKHEREMINKAFKKKNKSPSPGPSVPEADNSRLRLVK